MYMLFTTLGTLYLIVFGAEIAYMAVFGGDGDDSWSETERLEGHPVRFNLTGHIVAVVSAGWVGFAIVTGLG